MPTRRANGVYYVKRRFPAVGTVYKSLKTRSAARARALEQMLISLHGQGRVELIRAFDHGRVGIHELAEHYESSRIHELTGRLKRTDAKLAEACDAALRSKAPDAKATTLNRYETGLQHFRRLFQNDATVREVLTTDRIQEFKAFRLKEGAAKETINNDLGAVSILCTYALRQGWIEERPEIRRFPSAVRINYLEADQLAAYMAALRRPFRPLFQLLVGSGMRLGEAEGLRVSDLRFGDDGTRALIEDAKTLSGVRAVFLPDWVAQTLRAHIEDEALSGTGRPFAIPRRTVQKEHNRACEIVGIHGYTIHDHRHTAAVHLARAGMPLHLLQQQLGHANVTQTMRYARFHPDYSDVGKYFERVGMRLGVAGAAGVWR